VTPRSNSQNMNDYQEEGAGSARNRPESSHTVKLPEFWPDNLVAWFALAESHFHMRDIYDEWLVPITSGSPTINTHNIAESIWYTYNNNNVSSETGAFILYNQYGGFYTIVFTHYSPYMCISTIFNNAIILSWGGILRHSVWSWNANFLFEQLTFHAEKLSFHLKS